MRVLGSQSSAPCPGVTHRLKSLNMGLSPVPPLSAEALGELFNLFTPLLPHL